MGITGSNKANIFNRRVLSATTLGSNLLEYLDTRFLRSFKMLTTGRSAGDDAGAFFQGATASDGTAASTLDFSDLYGTDGTGESFDLETSDTFHSTYFDEVVFEDATSTTYFLGVKQVEVPEGVTTDTSTGIQGYDSHQKVLGDVRTVTSVADNGDGTVTLQFDRRNSGDDLTGRTVKVWLDTPEGTSATAIVTGSCSAAGTVTVDDMAQDTVSTTASDYNLAVLGPIITKDDISPDSASGAGVAFIGTVVGGTSPRTFDHGDQVIIGSASGTVNRVEDLIARGWITTPTLSYAGTDVSIGTGGVAYVSGTMYDVAADTLTLTGAAGTYFIVWSAGDGLTQVSTYADATSGQRIPVAMLDWDGSTASSNRVEMFRRVKHFNRTITATVANDPDLDATFRTLEAALGAAALVRRATGDAHVGFYIDVVGKITLSSAITESSLMEVPNVTIAGRGNAIAAGAIMGTTNPAYVATYNPMATVIEYNATTLFDYSGSAEHFCYQWTFKDLVIHKASGTAYRGVIHQTGSTDVNTSLTFEGCFILADQYITSAYTAGNADYLVKVDTGDGRQHRLTMRNCTAITGVGLLAVEGDNADVTITIDNVDYIGGSRNTTVVRGATFRTTIDGTGTANFDARISNSRFTYLTPNGSIGGTEKGIGFIYAPNQPGTITLDRVEWDGWTGPDMVPVITLGSTNVNTSPQDVKVTNCNFELDILTPATDLPTDPNRAAIFYALMDHSGIGGSNPHSQQITISGNTFTVEYDDLVTAGKEDAPVLLFEAYIQGGGGVHVVNNRIIGGVGVYYEDGQSSSTAEHTSFMVSSNVIHAIKRGVKVFVGGGGRMEAFNINGNTVMFYGDAADDTADPPIGVEIDATTSQGSVLINNNLVHNSSAGEDTIGIQSSQVTTLASSNLCTGGSDDGAGSIVLDGENSVAAANIAGGNNVVVADDSIAIGNIIGDNNSSNWSLGSDVIHIGNMHLSAGFSPVLPGQRTLFIGNHSSSGIFMDDTASDSTVALNYTSLLTVGGDDIVVVGNNATTRIQTESVSSSADHLYLDGSVVVANITPDLGRRVGDDELFVHESVVALNVCGEAAIQRPRNESGTGTGGQDGNSVVMGNVATSQLDIVLTNSVVVGNLIGVEDYADGLNVLNHAFDTKTTNSGSAGGDIECDGLAVAGNVISGGTALYGDIFALAANIIHGYSSADPFGAGSTSASIWVGTNGIGLANCTDQGIVFENGTNYTGSSVVVSDGGSLNEVF